MRTSVSRLFHPDQPCASFYHDARTYREFRPSPSLSDFVLCYWTSPPDGYNSLNLPVSPAEETIVPDSCIDIVFNITATGVTSHVVGPFDSPLIVPVNFAHAKDFGVRFLLPDFSMFFGISPGEFINTGVRSRDIFGETWKIAEEMVGTADDDYQRVCILDRILPQFARLSVKHSDTVTLAFNALFSKKGCITVDEVASSTGISSRHLNRITIEHTGFSVKTIARIIRFQHLLGSLRSEPDISFSVAAYDAGFSDQAHMIREFRSFTGKTPSMIV